MYNALLCKIENISTPRDAFDVLFNIILARLGDEIDLEQCVELTDLLMNEWSYHARFIWPKM